jgi:Late competence development protein ComFB
MSIYKNVMELLVEEEVGLQFKALPPRVATYINQVEWVAHALNQLPPLYATSEKGLHHQVQRGKAKHHPEIKQAVVRALAAISRDPLRSSIPLESPYAPFREVLMRLRALLRNDRLEWDSIPSAVEQALTRPPHRQPAPRSSTDYLPVPAQTSITPQLVTQTAAVSRPAAQEETFGWDDPLYNPR